MNKILLFLLISIFGFIHAEEWIYYCSAYKLARISPDGLENEILKESNVPSGFHLTDISLDKTKLLYITGNGGGTNFGEVVILDLESLDVQVTYLNPDLPPPLAQIYFPEGFYFPEGASFTDNENEIIFIEDQYLYKYSFLDSSVTLLTENENGWGENGHNHIWNISQSPDKTKIAYMEADSDSSHLIVFDIQNNATSVLGTFSTPYDGCSQKQVYWSTSNYILFSICDMNDLSNLFKIHSLNGESAQLIENEIFNIIETRESPIEKFVYTKNSQCPTCYRIIDLESNEISDPANNLHYEYNGSSLNWYSQSWSSDQSKVVMAGYDSLITSYSSSLYIYDITTDSFTATTGTNYFIPVFWVEDNIEYNGPVWHVATTGSDSTGLGSINSPFATIQKGIDTSSDGDTVLVSPGLYCGSVNFTGKNIVVGSHFLIDNSEAIIDSTILGPGDYYDYNSNCGDFFGGIQFIGGEDSTAHFIGFTITGTFGNSPIKCIDSSPSLSYLNIRNNYINSDGGGSLYIINSEANLDNLIISDNGKGGQSYGGAAVYIDNSSITINNSLVYNNSAIYEHHGYSMRTYTGGIVAVNNSILNLDKISFYGNSGTGADSYEPFGYGSALHLYDSSNATILNSILWNEGNIFTEELKQVVGSADISFSNIIGGWEGEGNIDVNPLFCDPDSVDFSLSEDSPCVATGQNNATMGALGVGCEALLSVENDIVPFQYILYQNYPNPFNPTTKIRYDLPKNEFVSINIYDVTGRKVKSLIGENQVAGYRSITWDGTNNLGQSVSAGMYIYIIQAGQYRESRKMVLLK